MVAKIGVDTAENEPSKVCSKIFPRCNGDGWSPNFTAQVLMASMLQSVAEDLVHAAGGNPRAIEFGGPGFEFAVPALLAALAVFAWVERFDRRGTEPFELF